MDLEPHSYWHQKTKSGTTKPGLKVPIYFDRQGSYGAERLVEI